MRKYRFFLRVGVGLLIMGCSVTRKHPTQPESEWAQVHAGCERMVRESIRPSEDAHNVLDEMTLIKKCMKLKRRNK